MLQSESPTRKTLMVLLKAAGSDVSGKTCDVYGTGKHEKYMNSPELSRRRKKEAAITVTKWPSFVQHNHTQS
jgi:hypothetical protein